MITAAQYFAGKPFDEEEAAAADDLLDRVNELLAEAEGSGVPRRICPNTGTEISGSKNGAGDGGFRLPNSTTGSAKSSHKEAMAVDVYDPGEALDHWLLDHILESYGLYRESPDATPGWCHLQTRQPHSGRRTFRP